MYIEAGRVTPLLSSLTSVAVWRVCVCLLLSVLTLWASDTQYPRNSQLTMSLTVLVTTICSRVFLTSTLALIKAAVDAYIQTKLRLKISVTVHTQHKR